MSDSDDRAGADARADAKAGRGGAEFLEQARWLLQWHNQRGEAITTRATAVLGFVGVVLALLLQGAGIKDFEPRWWTWVALATGLLCLLISGVCALMVVLPRDTQMPSVGQLRAWWAAQMADASQGATSAQIAESILIGKDLAKDSPISDAVEGADRRAWWFKRSAVALLGAFGPLTATVVDVLVRVGR